MITSLYAGILGLLFLKITLDTIKVRRRFKVSLGNGPNNEIQQFVSAHSNFAAFAIFLIVQLFLFERSNLVPGYIIHLLGTSFSLGRFLHYFAFSSSEMGLVLLEPATWLAP